MIILLTEYMDNPPSAWSENLIDDLWLFAPFSKRNYSCWLLENLFLKYTIYSYSITSLLGRYHLKMNSFIKSYISFLSMYHFLHNPRREGGREEYNLSSLIASFSHAWPGWYSFHFTLLTVTTITTVTGWRPVFQFSAVIALSVSVPFSVKTDMENFFL